MTGAPEEAREAEGFVPNPLLLAVSLGLLLLAFLEDLVGRGGLVVGTTALLRDAAPLNIIHWGLGLILLGALLSGPWIARVVAAAIAVGMAGWVLVSVADRSAVGHVLGFRGALPWSYALLHAAAAILVLLGALAGSRRTP